MNSLINHLFESKKFSHLLRKFISSLALYDNPSIEPYPDSQNHTALNPIQLLNSYAKSGRLTLAETKITHGHSLRTHVSHSDLFALNSLLDCYFKCNHKVYAFKLFEQILDPDVVSWNIMISGCNKNSFFRDSWQVFCRMHSSDIEMNQFTYGGVLSACGALECVSYAKQVYGFVIKNGFFSNGYVRAGMIDLFMKSCGFKDALKVFYDALCDNVVCWNAVISGAVKNGENWVALDYFSWMCCYGSLKPNVFTFSSVLSACAALQEPELGKGVQGWVIKCGAEEDIFVATAIIDLYVKCTIMDEAVKQFKQMRVHNVVSWTAIISGFAQQGDSLSAIHFFDEMRKRKVDINHYTITSVLTACVDQGMAGEATQIHCWILKTGFSMDSVVRGSLIKMYSRVGEVNLSEMAFAETDNLNHASLWSNMISAFVQNEIPEKAIHLFIRMLKEGVSPDKFCTSSVLSTVDCLTLGRQIHGFTLKNGLALDVSVGSALFTMHSKCGDLMESHKVFQQLEGKDNVSWASMIAGFSEHGYPEKAIRLFKEMLCEGSMPDGMVLTAVLTACSALCSSRMGKEVHGFSLRWGFSEQVTTCGALVNMYSKSGDLNSARIVFDMMPLKGQVSCSSLVSGYAQNGCIDEALQLFHDMLLADGHVDAYTISSILRSVALFTRPGSGTQLHARIIKMGLESEDSVGSSLILLYTKCGSISDCSKAFHEITRPDVVSWTAMISSYAQHGRGLEALHVFDNMTKSRIKPDAVTFVGVLSACSHAGLIEEGHFHLNSMRRDYGIEPGQRHYACMVDILGRAGRLREAERLINNMPIEPDALVWGTLLAACKVHGDVELGKLAAEKIMELEPPDAGAYVSLSNICADMGRWEDVLRIRSVLNDTGVTKEPGWSSV